MTALYGALVPAPDRKREEAQGENHQTGNVPTQVFGEPIVQNSEPGEHLAEQPAVQAVRNARRGTAPARPAAVVEAQVDHLDQRVDPRQHADAAQLRDEDRICVPRRTDRVKDVHDQPEEQRTREEYRADTRQSRGREPRFLAGVVGWFFSRVLWWFRFLVSF